MANGKNGRKIKRPLLLPVTYFVSNTQPNMLLGLGAEGPEQKGRRHRAPRMIPLVAVHTSSLSLIK